MASAGLDPATDFGLRVWTLSVQPEDDFGALHGHAASTEVYRSRLRWVEWNGVDGSVIDSCRAILPRTIVRRLLLVVLPVDSPVTP